MGDISLSIYDIYNKTVRDLVSGRQNLEKHLRETADGSWDFVERGTKKSLLQVGAQMKYIASLISLRAPRHLHTVRPFLQRNPPGAMHAVGLVESCRAAQV